MAPLTIRPQMLLYPQEYAIIFQFFIFLFVFYLFFNYLCARYTNMAKKRAIHFNLIYSY